MNFRESVLNCPWRISLCCILLVWSDFHFSYVNFKMKIKYWVKWKKLQANVRVLETSSSLFIVFSKHDFDTIFCHWIPCALSWVCECLKIDIFIVTFVQSVFRETFLCNQLCEWGLVSSVTDCRCLHLHKLNVVFSCSVYAHGCCLSEHLPYWEQWME